MAKAKNIYNGIRYVKQRDISSCGPVAIINIFKWLELPVRYDFIHITRHICKWSDARHYSGGGTCNKDLNTALKYFGISNKMIEAPNIKDIDDHIDKGGAVLLSYWIPYPHQDFSVNEGHFALCIDRTQKSYIMVNDGTKHTIGRRSKSTMKGILKQEIDSDRCVVWLIKK